MFSKNSSSNNNNNPNLPNSNDQTNMLSVPLNPPNKSSGKFHSHPATMNGKGGKQPFGNASQQSESGSAPRKINRNDIKTNGTVEYIGFNHFSDLPKDKGNMTLAALTARNGKLNSYSSDELRIADYYHLKNCTLTPQQMSNISHVINTNLDRIGSSSVHSHFSPAGLPLNLVALFSDSIQNSLPPRSTQLTSTPEGFFTKPQPSFQNTNETLKQVQQHGLFGSSPRDPIRLSGTVGFVGHNKVKHFYKSRENAAIITLTARGIGYTLDELRMVDYFHLKNNTLTLENQKKVKNIIDTNLNYSDSSSVHSHFSSTGLPPNLAALYDDSNSETQNSSCMTQKAIPSVKDKSSNKSIFDKPHFSK